mmetsp:Transcript_19210/g.44602  ORF Transcript_19210/g.44602 Transcript_19210/m.44602 type:complete len:599 (-) Transcript_19210:114-1910(-)
MTSSSSSFRRRCGALASSVASSVVVAVVLRQLDVAGAKAVAGGPRAAGTAGATANCHRSQPLEPLHREDRGRSDQQPGEGVNPQEEEREHAAAVAVVVFRSVETGFVDAELLLLLQFFLVLLLVLDRRRRRRLRVAATVAVEGLAEVPPLLPLLAVIDPADPIPGGTDPGRARLVREEGGRVVAIESRQVIEARGDEDPEELVGEHPALEDHPVVRRVLVAREGDPPPKRLDRFRRREELRRGPRIPPEPIEDPRVEHEVVEARFGRPDDARTASFVVRREAVLDRRGPASVDDPDGVLLPGLELVLPRRSGIDDRNGRTSSILGTGGSPELSTELVPDPGGVLPEGLPVVVVVRVLIGEALDPDDPRPTVGDPGVVEDLPGPSDRVDRVDEEVVLVIENDARVLEEPLRRPVVSGSVPSVLGRARVPVPADVRPPGAVLDDQDVRFEVFLPGSDRGSDPFPEGDLRTERRDGVDGRGHLVDEEGVGRRRLEAGVPRHPNTVDRPLKLRVPFGAFDRTQIVDGGLSDALRLTPQVEHLEGNVARGKPLLLSVCRRRRGGGQNNNIKKKKKHWEQKKAERPRRGAVASESRHRAVPERM